MHGLIKSSHGHILILAPFFVLIFIFYLWTVSSGHLSVLNFSKEAKGYHGYMADAFLHGQLNLRIDPSPELLALEDPYDPDANAGHKLWDATLYKGKYFLYFTPTVALLFIVPFKTIFGYFLSEPLLTALLCFVGYIFAYFTFIRILRIGSVQVSLPTLLTSALVFATANTVPFLLRRPDVYELCIAAGYVFMMAGTYFLLGAMTSERKRSVCAQTIAAGILLGLCISSRPNQLFACGVLIIAFIVIRRFLFREKARALISYVGLLTAPIVLIGIAMCWYNYARFGSILEFGFSYQLAGVHPQRTVSFSLFYLPLGLYRYFFQSIPFDLRFPFFHVVSGGVPFPVAFPYYCEPTVGLMSLPVYWLIFIPLFCVRSLWKESSAFLILSVFILAVGLTSLCVISTMVGCTMRYIVDFSPMLLLATVSIYLLSRKYVFNPNGPGVTLGRQCFYVTALFSIFISLCISMTGYYDNFKNSSPKLYQRLEKMFSLHINAIPTAKVLPNAPWEKLKDLRIEAIRNPNGLERDSSGVPFFWLGNAETEIELFSTKSGTAHFTAEVYPGPCLPESNKRRIRISSGQYLQELTINGPQESFVFVVPIQAGENVVRVLSLDKPTIFKLSNDDTRSLLVMFRRLRLVGVSSEVK